METLTDDEVAALLGAASERTKLYLLLALNCGMYGKDISDIQQGEVDWEEGRITRRRSKTRNRSERVPIVCYKLWDETFRLLKEHGKDDRPHVLLNEDGGLLWTEKTKDGKYTRSKPISCAYRRLLVKLKWKEKGHGFKLLRKTAASKLEEHAEYGRYAEYFLGEAPSSVAERHYVKPSQQQFDDALAWLAEQFDKQEEHEQEKDGQ